MSVVFVVIPAVVVGWPVLCGAIAGAAATLGYRALNTGQSLSVEEPEDRLVEITLESSEVIADAMKRESEFAVRKDDITATFRRAADGRCQVHVTGKDTTDEELRTIGRELVGRVTQQYAYNKVLSELKKQGFTVAHEEVTADQAIRIRVSKYV